MNYANKKQWKRCINQSIGKRNTFCSRWMLMSSRLPSVVLQLFRYCCCREISTLCSVDFKNLKVTSLVKHFEIRTLFRKLRFILSLLRFLDWDILSRWFDIFKFKKLAFSMYANSFRILAANFTDSDSFVLNWWYNGVHMLTVLYLWSNRNVKFEGIEKKTMTYIVE